MVNITEDGRYYSNYNGKIHEDTIPFYVDDWIWDSYLAHHPLRAILDPDEENDMMTSFVRMYEQSGWLPQFCLVQGEVPVMNGFHSTITFFDDGKNVYLKKKDELLKIKVGIQENLKEKDTDQKMEDVLSCRGSRIRTYEKP